MTRVHIITNPASGSLISSKILPKVIESLQSESSLNLNLIKHETKSERDGQNVAKKIIESEDQEREKKIEQKEQAVKEGLSLNLNLVILGGDGTTHELLDGFFNPDLHQSSSAVKLSSNQSIDYPKINIALVPIGTSNALYHSIYPPESQENNQDSKDENQDEDSWRFKSLKSMIESFLFSTSSSNHDHQIPLTLSLTKHTDNGNHKEEESKTVSHLLTSHSLHASILKDSEILRKSIPTIERFKIAAQKNSIIWTNGIVKLFSDENFGIQKFDRKSKKFLKIDLRKDDENNHKKEVITLEGPFIYLICLSIDRLEPNFIPAPFSSTHIQKSNPNNDSNYDSDFTRPSDLLDILMIRPLNDPSVRNNLKRKGINFEYNQQLQSETVKKVSNQSDHLDQLWNGEETLSIRQKFAETRLGEISIGMYDGGKHVGLGYKNEIEIEKSIQEKGENQDNELKFQDLEKNGEGNGIEVVEYYRCKGYEWNPNPKDSRASLTCIDGTVLESSKTSSEIMKESIGKVWIWK